MKDGIGLLPRNDDDYSGLYSDKLKIEVNPNSGYSIPVSKMDLE
jgi:hypothetical protein